MACVMGRQQGSQPRARLLLGLNCDVGQALMDCRKAENMCQSRIDVRPVEQGCVHVGQGHGFEAGSLENSLDNARSA
jgi:hypothetical protein